jgi:phosphohistidine phosphatase
MRSVARGLHFIHPKLDLIASSPLVRATQTAAILAAAYGRVPVIELAELAPGGTEDAVWAWLNQRPQARIALVGHEPELGELISWFLSGEPEPALGLKKAGACALRFGDGPGPGQAQLRWLLPPKVLRRLGA